MKIAYFDCIAGASGDMILGSLLDAGLPESVLRERLAALHLPGWELQARRVSKNGFSAMKVDVLATGDVPERHLYEIEALVRAGDLPDHVQTRALRIFRRLGEVEAGIHGLPVDQVHLHELGGIDTMVDVVGALVGLDALGVEQVYVSPLPLGRGIGRSAHGPLPLPAPATAALLKGAPVLGSELETELVTPTGAALLTDLASGFGQIPAMTLNAVGYGAGGRDLPIPNVLRVLIGEGKEQNPTGLRDPSGLMDLKGLETEELVVLETNVDDLNPEVWEWVMGRLFEAGALDVTLSPVQMKKNRPATLLSALCRPGDAEKLSAILFAETSTLGVRKSFVQRQALPRRVQAVETPWGTVRVKIARWGTGEGQVKLAPEYEDCRRLAAEHHVPLREVYRAAERAAGDLRS